MARIVRTALTWVWATATVAALGGCLTPPLTERTESSPVGPVGPDISAPASHDKVRLDVVIPIFDPGLPDLTEDRGFVSNLNPMRMLRREESKVIWPELRRAEANRFAVLLKKELDATGMFGEVRVSPDKTATGDLYVMGKIVEARGEDVEIEVTVQDISDSEWQLRDDEYKYQVQKDFFRYEARNKGKDPYQPVFKKVAEAIGEQVRKRSNEDLTSIRNLTKIRFARFLAPDSFDPHIEREGNRWRLKSMPAREDPMLQRTEAARVQEDHQFMSKLGEKYQAFYDDTQESYLVYQKAAFEALDNYKRERNTAIAKGGVAIILTVVAILLGRDAEASSTAQQVTAALAATAGAAVLRSVFSDVQEAKRHSDTLAQLGNDIDLSMSPTVMEIEDQTVEVTGDAREQLHEWREHLKRIYDLEKVPERKL